MTTTISQMTKRITIAAIKNTRVGKHAVDPKTVTKFSNAIYDTIIKQPSKREPGETLAVRETMEEIEERNEMTTQIVTAMVSKQEPGYALAHPDEIAKGFQTIWDNIAKNEQRIELRVDLGDEELD